MAEKDEVDVEGAAKPKRVPKPKPEKSASGGGGGPAAIVPWVIAVAALGMCGFMFFQLNSISTKLKHDTGPKPKGVAGEEGAAEGEHGAGTAARDWTPEAAVVEYPLEELTANTSDGRYAKLNMTLQLESYYEMPAWEAYLAQMKKYKDERQLYFDFTTGKVDAEGKEIKKKGKGGHAMVNGAFILAGQVEVIEAQHGGGKAAEPPKLPEEPARPLTVMETELQKKDAEMRDTIMGLINAKPAAELTSPEGREAFKQEIIDTLNSMLERHLGSVTDVFFKNLVTT